MGLAVGVVTLAACGSSNPPPLQPMDAGVPSDLCRQLPAQLTNGLTASTSSDTTGNPVAACALRSADGSGAVQMVVTVTQLDAETSAQQAYQSQCRSLDTQTYDTASSPAVQGADSACGGKARSGVGAVVFAVKGLDVTTARVDGTALQAGVPDGLTAAQQLAQAALGGSSGSASPGSSTGSSATPSTAPSAGSSAGG